MFDDAFNVQVTLLKYYTLYLSSIVKTIDNQYKNIYFQSHFTVNAENRKMFRILTYWSEQLKNQ